MHMPFPGLCCLESEEILIPQLSQEGTGKRTGKMRDIFTSSVVKIMHLNVY